MCYIPNNENKSYEKEKSAAQSPRTPRIKTEKHRGNLKVLATASPDKLAQAVVRGFGFKKAKPASS